MDHQGLWHRYKKQNDIEAKKYLIEHYVELVRIVAGRLYASYHSGIEYEDLVSYGILGLIDAIEKFEIEKNVKFETYAQIRIRGAIIDQLRNLDWVPRSIRQKSKQIEQAYVRVENRLGRSAYDHEIANELEISVAELHNTLQQLSSFNVISLEEKLLDGYLNDSSIVDRENLPENILCHDEMNRLLQNSIENLPEREKQVISLYYFEELTYKEIGAILQISESRVSQLHSKAVSRLKAKLIL